MPPFFHMMDVNTETILVICRIEILCLFSLSAPLCRLLLMMSDLQKGFNCLSLLEAGTNGCQFGSNIARLALSDG